MGKRRSWASGCLERKVGARRSEGSSHTRTGRFACFMSRAALSKSGKQGFKALYRAEMEEEAKEALLELW